MKVKDLFNKIACCSPRIRICECMKEIEVLDLNNVTRNLDNPLYSRTLNTFIVNKDGSLTINIKPLN